LITKQHQQTKINKNKTQTFSICLFYRSVVFTDQTYIVYW